MRRFINFLPVLALVLLLGCKIPERPAVTPSISPTLSSTPETLPTAPIQTEPPVTLTPINEAPATLLPIPSQTLTSTSIPLTIDPTYLNFPTITPTPTLDPTKILLQIVAPGPMSKVVSPIQFVVHVAPNYTGTTRIELIGEDGVELYRKVFKTYSNIGYFTPVKDSVDFEINGAAEMARLQVSTLDEWGRLQAFNSVRLLLLSVGGNEFTPSFAPLERVLLRYPNRSDEIAGGTLVVMGEFLPLNDLPVILELFDINNKLIGSRVINLAHADGTYQQFTTTIPYQIPQATQSRLVIHQADDRIEGLAYLYSIRLLVSP